MPFDRIAEAALCPVAERKGMGEDAKFPAPVPDRAVMSDLELEDPHEEPEYSGILIVIHCLLKYQNILGKKYYMRYYLMIVK